MVKQFEHILFRQSDFVLYANQQLFDAEKDKVAGRSVLIGHGVDTELFSPVGPVAPEVANIPRPRVGFFGDLSEWMVNFELLASIARRCPTIHFVLGGPQLDYVAAFEQLRNVHVLPPCPHQEMPARWRAMDAAILPYQRTAWQEASEPIKLNEILAMGIPAIGTRIPAFSRHSDSIRIAETPEDFADALWRVLATSDGNDTNRRQARRATVSLNSWESIADSIDHMSKQLLSNLGLMSLPLAPLKS
jgi:glycosyltransferase involved in cell wall biosynthesis